MSEEEKQSHGNEPPKEEIQKQSQSEFLDDARSRALAEALQSSFKIVRVFMVILASAFMCSGITKVNENEQALLLRFGVYKSPPLSPGLHFAWPYPIDEIVKIAVEKERPLESNVGWLTNEEDPQEPQDSFSFAPDYDGYALTGDGNTIHIKASATYSLPEASIDDFEFNFKDTAGFINSALDNAVYHAAASHSALDAITNKSKIADAIRRQITKVLQANELEINLSSFNVTAAVPLGVKPAFDAFSAADAAKVERIRKAEGEAKSSIAIAEGQAKVILSNGKTEANRLLTSVEAEAKSFTNQRPFYESNPDLFRQRLITETMQRVLTNAVDVFYLSGRQPRIWLNRTPAKKKLKEGEVR